MSELRSGLRNAVNGVLGAFGLKAVSAKWGPRGAMAALVDARRAGFHPRTVVDVGASNGQWSRECLHVFPDPQYLLIDPLEENRAPLDRFAQAHSRASFWMGVAGPEDGLIDLNAHGDQSSVLSSTDFASAPRKVPMRSLDSFIEPLSLQGPVMLKADVQGFELEVLRGAKQLLAMTELLLLETSFVRLYDGCPLAHEVIAAVCAQGFRVHDICTYIQRPGDRRLAQADLLFVSTTSALNAHEGWLPG
jgi:FkbM family methyltransferase